MADTKPFKTKLCVLYQTGRCARRTCTFAHGDAELRRSFPERRSNKDSDLRNKLDRKRSPVHRYSAERDSRDSRAFRRSSPPLPFKRRKYGMHEHMDVQSDFSRDLRSPDGALDRGKDKTSYFSDHRCILEDELKQVQHEVDVFLEKKRQLEIQLREQVQEVDSLSSRVRDHETQLSEERDKFKRLNSKIKKLIRVHVHHSRLQDETKRSQLEFEQLLEEFWLDGTQVSDTEDHLNVNIISDEGVSELKDQTSPVKRSYPSSMKLPQDTKSADTVRGHRVRIEMDNKRKDNGGVVNESILIRCQKDASKSSSASDKLKVQDSNVMAPSTSMAAHAVDDFVELVETDDNDEAIEATTVVQNGFSSTLPPLPRASQNNFSQYEGDDDDKVDVDGIEEHEVDII